MNRRLAMAVLLTITTHSLFAGAWKLEIQGAKELGSAYAGSAALAEDASTVWFNPAGMAHLKQRSLTGGLAVVDLSIKYHDEHSTTLLGQPVTGESVAEGGAMFVVPHGYLATPLGDRAWFGFGFNTPYGLGTDYGETWVGRYQAVNTELLVYNLNPAFAYAVNDQLSLGAGLDLQYAEGSFGEMIDFGSIGFAYGMPLTPQQHDGSVEVEGDDWAIGYKGGFPWTPGHKARLGLTYRSSTTAAIEGDSTFVVPPEAEALTAGGTLFQTTNAVAKLPMPETASISLVHEVTPAFSLLADATWTRWSEFDKLVIDFENPNQPPVVQESDWSDAWRYSLGASWKPNDRWTFRAGFADEATPVPDRTRDPRIPEGDHRWYTLGGSVVTSPRVSVDFFLVHLTTGDAPIDVSDPNAGTLKGDARWTIWNVGVGATFRY